MHAGIAEMVAQIEVTPKNEALVDRLKEARFLKSWDASTVSSIISYAIHADDRLTWNLVCSILRIVVEGMEADELHKAAELSREAMMWIVDYRAELHRMVIEVAETTEVTSE